MLSIYPDLKKRVQEHLKAREEERAQQRKEAEEEEAREKAAALAAEAKAKAGSTAAADDLKNPAEGGGGLSWGAEA